MQQQKGNLSVNTENLMPIIKKWLYSDRDIFLRELVSNACDAVSKLNKIASLGEAKPVEKPEVRVLPDAEAGTITVEDNGIGMTAEEIEKYINQVAFSGAAEFMQKYEKTGADGIIGHFGLGFYSAFMVSDSVEIDTLSYQEGAEPVHWESDGTVEYTMSQGRRETPGTVITLHIAQDCREFLDSAELAKILNKYCFFLPYPVLLGEKKDGKTDFRQINDTDPLWNKPASECTDEQYREFYRKVFYDYNDPLFWIHLNVEYPFRLKGILYFPKLTQNIDTMQGQIKLYNNQVFVADNIKEVIPEFLMLLKGVIDCPDMPLNVSRSFLQNDATVRRISAHITKKVADRLTGMFESERDKYNEYWNDIGLFIKYGCMKDEKFYDRMKDCIIYKTVQGDYLTLDDYLADAKDSHENKVYYVTNEIQQAQYIKLFNQHDIDCVLLDGPVDGPFISFIESKRQGVTFTRIDSDLGALLGESAGFDGLCGEFTAMLDEANTTVKAGSIASDMPALLLLDEQNRRMQDMSRYYSGLNMEGMFPGKYTLTLNTNSELIKKLGLMAPGEEKTLIMHQVYDLAALANVPLTPERMTEFLKRSTQVLDKLAKAEEGQSSAAAKAPAETEADGGAEAKA